MTFIEIGNMAINLAHVRKVRRFRSRNKTSQVIIEYANGESESLDLDHEDEYRYFGNLKSNDATIIPAAPGFMTVTCWFWDDPPSLENIYRDPVIGWRTYKMDNTTTCDPITLDDGPSTNAECSTAILRPDGIVVLQACQRWDSIEEWMKTVHEEWEKWQANQKIKLASS